MSRRRTERERERQREFGRRIQRLREEQGLTQGDVTRMSGMDRSFISEPVSVFHLDHAGVWWRVRIAASRRLMRWGLQRTLARMRQALSVATARSPTPRILAW